MAEDGKGRHEAVVRVACVQMEPHVGDKSANVAKGVALIEEAAANGARLVVLPELCNSGYVFESRHEAFALAEPIPDGETVRTWARLARDHGLYISAGICERDGDLLYNSAAFIGPEGPIGTFRKVHLWNEENLFFERGNLGFPVWGTPIGRVAVLICYDGWFPEGYRLCALQGADIICISTNWVPIPGQDPNREAMANILCMSAAHTNSVFIAAADRVGTERGQPFIGQSSRRLLYRLARRRAGEPDRGGDHLRRLQPRRREAQAELERVQPSLARPAYRSLRRDAGHRRKAGLVLSSIEGEGGKRW